MHKSNANTSGATLVSLNEAFKASWRVLKEHPADEFEFAELINLLEIASAIYEGRAMHGVSRVLLEEYLLRVGNMIEGNDELTARVDALRSDGTTFIYHKRFLRKMRRTRPREPLRPRGGGGE